MSAYDLLKEVAIIFITSTIIGLRSNDREGTQSHHFMANRWGNSGNSDRLYFGGAPKSLQMVTTAMKLKDAYSLEEKL